MKQKLLMFVIGVVRTWQRYRRMYVVRIWVMRHGLKPNVDEYLVIEVSAFNV